MQTSTIVLLVAVALIPLAECAKRCYSGSKDNYESRVCDTGTNAQFMCQKFTCEGGKSPFVLRTCANQKYGCLAGPSTCRFAGGTGSCSRLDSNFTVRACAVAGSRCDSSATVCAEQGGVGMCELCEEDLCNPSNGLVRLSLVVIAVLFRLF